MAKSALEACWATLLQATPFMTICAIEQFKELKFYLYFSRQTAQTEECCHHNNQGHLGGNSNAGTIKSPEH
eukprot:scaffold2969_cov20-Tisochrysis_lutea.AAC.4